METMKRNSIESKACLQFKEFEYRCVNVAAAEAAMETVKPQRVGGGEG